MEHNSDTAPMWLIHTFCDEEDRRRELTESSAGCKAAPCCGCIRSKATCQHGERYMLEVSLNKATTQCKEKSHDAAVLDKQ